jgi:hypothetical protein
VGAARGKGREPLGIGLRAHVPTTASPRARAALARARPRPELTPVMNQFAMRIPFAVLRKG